MSAESFHMVIAARRLDQGDEAVIALRDWASAETSEIADAVSNLQLELQQRYALRTELHAVASRFTDQTSAKRSSSVASFSSSVHGHSQWDGDVAEGATTDLWRVKHIEQARALLRSELEQCVQELRSESANGETVLRSVCSGFESRVEREAGRLDQSHKDVAEKTNRLTAEMADQRTEVVAAETRCLESLSAIEKRVQLHEQEQGDVLAEFTSQIQADHEDVWGQCRSVVASVHNLSRELDERIHAVAIREDQAREELRGFLLQESESSQISLRDALGDNIKELEELFKGVASKWDDQALLFLSEQAEAASETNSSLSERIDAAEAATRRSVATLKDDLDNRVEILATEIGGCTRAAEQAAAGCEARLSRELTTIQRATQRLDATHAEATREFSSRQQESHEQIVRLQEELQTSIDRQAEAHNDLREEQRCNHKTLSSRHHDFEAEMSTRIEREYTGLHTLLVEGLGTAATNTSAVRGEVLSSLERTKAQLLQSVSGKANELVAQFTDRTDELVRALEEQRSSEVQRFTEIKGLAQTAETRVEDKLEKMAVECAQMAEHGRVALKCGLETAERQSLSQVESAECHLNAVMKSLIEDAAVAQSQAWGGAIATLAGDISKMQEEMLIQVERIEATGTEQCAAVGAESGRKLADSCSELRKQMEAAEISCAEAMAALKEGVEEHAEQVQELQAGLVRVTRNVQDEKMQIAASVEQAKNACAAVESRAAQSLQETCSELRRDVEEAVAALEAEAAAMASSQSNQLHEATAAAQQDSAELREIIRRRLEEQSATFECELVTKLAGVRDGLLSLAEAMEDRHAEMEQHVSEKVEVSLASLQDRVSDVFGSTSVRLTELATECTSCETRVALQRIDVGELQQAVRELNEAEGLLQLEERLSELQGEVADMATELALTAAVAEATALPQ